MQKNKPLLFLILLLILFSPCCYAQLSRYLEVSFTESVSYDSNVLQAEEAVDDISFRHSLFLSHSRERRFFEYQVSYNIASENFVFDPDNDNVSHNLNASIVHDSENYSFGVQGAFLISQQPVGLEIQPFTETQATSFSVFGNYQIFRDITIQTTVSHQVSETEGSERTRVISMSLNAQYAYRIGESVALTIRGGYTYVLDLVDEEESDDFRDISFGLNFFSLFGMDDFLTLNTNTGLERDSNEQENNLADANATANLNLLRVLPNADLPTKASINQLTFTFGFTEDAFEGAPIVFTLQANGLLSPTTTWSVLASREFEFAVNDLDRLQTTFTGAISHQMGSKLVLNINTTYTLEDLENNNSLSRFTQAVSLFYPIGGRSNFDLSYTYTEGISGREFVSHRVELSLTIPFY